MTSKIACFGVPSVFSFKSKVCESCNEFTQCQKDSYSALIAIREYPISTVALTQHEEFRVRSGQVVADPLALELTKPIPASTERKATRYALTTEQISRIATLPKKVGGFLEKLYVRGLDKQIERDVAEGKNPFSLTNARPYHAAYEVLSKGRVHRSKMSNELMEMLGWTYASSYSQVSMIWQIFPELGLAKEEGVFMTKAQPEHQLHNYEYTTTG